MQDIHQYKILILDFGSQYTQLIARRVRELGVYCEIFSYNLPDKKIKDFNANGIILSGGPATVTKKTTPRAPKIIFSLGCPVLGICYGMQTMAVQLGGNVVQAAKREFGFARAKITNQSSLFFNIADEIINDDYYLDVWMSHGDCVNKLPDNFIATASSDTTKFAAMEDKTRKFFGVQFHPEVTHTKQGARILENFLFTICECKSTWTIKAIIAERIIAVKNQVNKDKVILGLSGGVDSAVVAALVHSAIGKQLICICVDTGLLRLNEALHIKKMFAGHFKIKLIIVDAKKIFLQKLRGVFDPEKKRKIIGKLFIEVFQKEAKKIKGVAWLAQGTIYPDVIESAAIEFSSSQVIKSHHNVGGLPKKMTFKLLEPLRDLFKDEVRKVGLELGLPYEMVYRHPFPGPGLGVRILGEVKDKYVKLLQLADSIFIQELFAANYYYKVSQAFAVFLPVKSVGVMGDMRKYEYVISLRAVETVDFMTANWAQLPYDLLAKIANRICNEVSGVARVTYDISSKPPATIEWE